MTIDFPNSPSLNQQFQLGNFNYTWDGSKWSSATVAYLPLAGGTMTGALLLNADPSVPLGAVTKQYSDTKAPLASPTFTGVPAGPTPSPGTNTTQFATTAFVAAALTSVALTGIPTAPTASINTNTTQIATTAFVLTQAATTTPLAAGTANVGTGTTFARADHVHPTDTTRAALVSPALTGVPTAPTAALNANTTQIATTAFVLIQASSTIPQMNGSATAGSATTWSRNDHVHPTDTSRAPLASPTFTGVPAGPTATPGSSTTQLATTQFVAQAFNSPAMTGTPTAPNLVLANSLTIGGAPGPTWTTGTGAPSATQPLGSLYSRQDGAVGSTLYLSRGGGTWNAVAGV